MGQVRVRVASLDDVIASREWANRPKDHQALPELYQLPEAQTVQTAPGTPPGTKVPTVHEQHRLYEQLYRPSTHQAIEARQPPTV